MSAARLRLNYAQKGCDDVLWRHHHVAAGSRLRLRTGLPRAGKRGWVGKGNEYVEQPQIEL